MRFKTETSSQYEIDLEQKKIRRLSGSASPTARLGQDGEWKSYESICSSESGIDKPKVGEQLFIVWIQEETEALIPGSNVIKTTLTSQIVSIEEN